MHVRNRSRDSSRMVKGLLSACLIGSLAIAVQASELEDDHRLSMDFVTPHTAWAKPYAGGKTRVLVFINGRGTLPREIIELKQRFDLDAASVYWIRVIDYGNYKWLHGDAGIQRMEKLLDQPWDCYVMYQLPLTHMPVSAQYKLLKAVTLGKGLVMVGQDDKRVLKEKNRISKLPVFLNEGTPLKGLSFGTTPGDMMAAYRVRKGRALRTRARPNTGHDVGWDTEYEYWVQMLGRAILWTSGKEPKMKLKVKVTEPTCDWRRASDMRAQVEWRTPGPPPARQVQVDVSLRRFDGRTTLLKSLKAISTHGTIECGIGQANNEPINLRAGRYFVDMIVRGPQGVEAWGSDTFEVTSKRAVEKIELDSPYAEIRGTLSGKVTLTGGAGPGESVRVDLLDPHGRVIARTDLPIRPGAVAFQFGVKPWMPMLVRVVARLMREGKEVAHRHAWFHVTKRHRGRFNHLIWDYPKGTLAPWCERALAKQGMTLQLCGGNPPNYVAANGLAWVPYTIHIKNTLDANGIMNGRCWNDPKVVRERVAGLAAKYAPARQHGVFVYSLGDEIATRGSCLSPHCLTAYRKYLQEQYVSIGALNASWGSTYKSFGEVKLLDPKDNDAAEAKRRGIYSRWFDRQSFQSYNICRYYKQFGDAYRKIDPESRTGYEGAGRFDRGDDYDLIVRTNQFWSPYPGLGDEVIRSIAPRDFPRSNWMGYAKTADALIWKYWRMVTRGCDAVWWWRWDALGRFHGFLAPSLVPFDATREMIKDTQIVRRGLGDMLINSEMQTDGIGILYSQPSAYAAKVQTSPSYGSYKSNHAGFHGAVRDLGCNFRYFTDRQMRLGEVDLSKFKVIILAMAQAMGRQEAELFRAYVRNGGLLIADVRPAIYDGHLKPLTAGQLDDVFGITRTGSGNALNVDGQIKMALADGRLEALGVSKVRADGGVRAAGASAMGAAGKAPLFLTHSFGRGRAVLLNLAMASYPTLSAESTPETAARLWRLTLGMGQVSPVLSLNDASGQRLRNVEITRWMNGQVQIVSVFRHKGQPEPAKLSLPQAMYAYDLKNRKTLGKLGTIGMTITPYRAMFFALSPEPLAPVSLNVSPSVIPGGVQRVRIASAMPKGQQAVSVQVTLPDGAVADWVDSVTLVDRQGATVDVPVALNDPKGTWTVNATELYTGRTTTTKFSVK